LDRPAQLTNSDRDDNAKKNAQAHRSELDAIRLGSDACTRLSLHRREQPHASLPADFAARLNSGQAVSQCPLLHS